MRDVALKEVEMSEADRDDVQQDLRPLPDHIGIQSLVDSGFESASVV